jgi:hypothetical protein
MAQALTSVDRRGARRGPRGTLPARQQRLRARARDGDQQRRPGHHVDPVLDQYEYSPNYADFGHTDDNDHFFRQMDFLTPELLRVLQPGPGRRHPREGPGDVPGGLTASASRPSTRSTARTSSTSAARLRLHGDEDDRHRRGAREQSDLPARLDGAVQGRDQDGRRDAGVLAALPEAARQHHQELRRRAGGEVEAALFEGRWQVDAHGFARSNGTGS